MSDPGEEILAALVISGVATFGVGAFLRGFKKGIRGEELPEVRNDVLGTIGKVLLCMLFPPLILYFALRRVVRSEVKSAIKDVQGDRPKAP